MKNIWAPWRIKYILNEKPKSCIFCIQKVRNYQRKHLILCESSHAMVIMNKFPYTAGHLMVIPKRHIKTLDKLTRHEHTDFFELLTFATTALKKALNPDGLNIGANLGKVAGAGHESHLHFHIVARWNGDTNFMPIIGKSMVISEYLDKTYNKLLPFFKGNPL